CRTHRSVAVGDLSLLRPGGYRLQIGAGTKGSVRAPQHRHARRLVALERAKRLGQCLPGRAVDRVSPVRTVEDDGGDGTLCFGSDARSFHGWCSPSAPCVVDDTVARLRTIT